MNEKIYNKNIKIQIPFPVKEIIDTLESEGYEAFAVGGCVRDGILGREPKDWDITTSAKPEQVKALFKRTIDTGIKHGTVTVMIRGTGYEVTTYRIDGEYEDGRHPKEVLFTSNIVEDLKRRDFTINAMAYNERLGAVDCFGGANDLNDGIIRCVGNPEERFTEDALRMLRAVRFGAVLNFEICDTTREAIIKMASSITKISRERIQAELEKLLMSGSPERIIELYDTGLIKWIFSQDMYMDKNSERVAKLAETLKRSPADHYIRWAVFASFLQAEDILRSLKFDNKTIKICGQLLKYRDASIKAEEPGLKKMAVEIGRDIFGEYYLPYRRAMKNIDDEHISRAEAMYNKIIQRGDCLSTRELQITGRDLADIGVEQGRKMGEIINILFETVIEDYTKNNRKELLEIAKKYT